MPHEVLFHAVIFKYSNLDAVFSCKGIPTTREDASFIYTALVSVDVTEKTSDT